MMCDATLLGSSELGFHPFPCCMRAHVMGGSGGNLAKRIRSCAALSPSISACVCASSTHAWSDCGSRRADVVVLVQLVLVPLPGTLTWSWYWCSWCWFRAAGAGSVQVSVPGKRTR